MDIMMPVMDGLTAMAQLRQTSNVPVILLTAKGEDTDKVLGLNVGADDYITKPFNPVEMLARVRSQLRRYLQLGGGQVRPARWSSAASVWTTTQGRHRGRRPVGADTERIRYSPLPHGRMPGRCSPPARSTAGCGTTCR